MAVFVVGMHRSGTSTVASVLDALGVNFGRPDELLAANEANLAGYYENKRILQIDEKFTGRNGLNWRTLPAIERHKKITGVTEYLADVEAVSATLRNSEHWGAKDPRLSFLLPYWRAAAPDASAIICIRRPEAVALSLQHRNEVALPYGAALWELYTIAALKNTRRMPRLAVVYEDMLADPENTVHKIIAAIPELAGKDFSQERIHAAAKRILPSLDNSERDMQTLDFLTEHQTKLYNRLSEGNLSLSKRAELAPISRELVRLEAGHQSAKASAALANDELTRLRDATEQEELEQLSILVRLKDLLKLAGEKIGDSDTPDAVIQKLGAIVRKAGVPSPTVEELTALKDERISWYKDELFALNTRMTEQTGAYDMARKESWELKSVLVELKHEVEQGATLANERPLLLADLSAVREQLLVKSSEHFALSLSNSKLATEARELREQVTALRRAAALNEVNLSQAQARDTASMAEVRRLKALEVDLRTSILQAKERTTEILGQLAERERSETFLKATIGKLRERNATNTEVEQSLAECEALNIELAATRMALNDAKQAIKVLEEEVTTLRSNVEVIEEPAVSMVAPLTRPESASHEPTQEHATLKTERNELDRNLRTTQIALTNALQLVSSLEAELSDLRTKDKSAASGRGSEESVEPRDTTESEIIEKLRADCNGLRLALAAAQKASMPSAEIGSAAHLAEPRNLPSELNATNDRLRRQFTAMSQLIQAIDELLNPPIGGRFWIPVRKVRIKLVQLRAIVGIETSLLRQG